MRHSGRILPYTPVLRCSSLKGGGANTRRTCLVCSFLSYFTYQNNKVTLVNVMIMTLRTIFWRFRRNFTIQGSPETSSISFYRCHTTHLHQVLCALSFLFTYRKELWYRHWCSLKYRLGLE